MALLTAFGGIYPRLPEHQLPANAARTAHNVKLRNSRIEPWREKEPVVLANSTAKTLHVKDCCYLTWDNCVSVVDWIPDDPRMFITGRAEKPETAVLVNCIPQYFWLGVPKPASTLALGYTHGEGRTAAARSYIYTYVNQFGEEGPPSSPSTTISVVDGALVTVSGFAYPEAKYGAVSIRIYRTATGHRTGAEQEQTPYTDYLLVAEVPSDTVLFEDRVLDRHLGHAIATREFREPPAQLRHIQHIEGTGMLSGVTQNRVHISSPFQPNNWPAENDLTLDQNIVGHVTHNNTIYVSTDGYPYVIDGSNICDIRKCRAVDGGDVALPDISCGYAHSSIATPFGMVYSSKDGLVLLNQNATATILTAQWFSTEEWAKVRPETVRLAYHRGYLFFITDTHSFVLELDADMYGDHKPGALTTLSDRPIDMLETRNGELMLLENSLVYHWEAGDTYRPYKWHSPGLTFGGESSPPSAKVRTTDTVLHLVNETNGVTTSRPITNEKPVRLGRIGRSYYYSVGVTGTGPVDFIDIGMHHLTVNRGA